MNRENARFASSGFHLGAHIVAQAFNLELTEEKCLQIDDLLREVANGTATTVGSAAEMKVSEELRGKVSEISQKTAQMVVWWHENAQI